jgi:hypothetical protein
MNDIGKNMRLSSNLCHTRVKIDAVAKQLIRRGWDFPVAHYYVMSGSRVPLFKYYCSRENRRDPD